MSEAELSVLREVAHRVMELNRRGYLLLPPGVVELLGLAEQLRTSVATVRGGVV